VVPHANLTKPKRSYKPKSLEPLDLQSQDSTSFEA